MQLVFTIFRVLGFSLLGLLGLVVVLLFVPVALDVYYGDGGLKVNLRILFLRFKLFPQKAKKAKTPAEKKELAREETARSFDLKNLKKIKQIIQPAGKTMAYILKRIKIKNLRVRVEICRPDVADTGIAAGNTWAALGFLLEMLKGYFTVRVKELLVAPDFRGEEPRFALELGGRIQTLPLFLVIAAVQFLLRWLKLNRESEEVSNEQSQPNLRHGRDGDRQNQRGHGLRDGDRKIG